MPQGVWEALEDLRGGCGCLVSFMDTPSQTSASEVDFGDAKFECIFLSDLSEQLFHKFLLFRYAQPTRVCFLQRFPHEERLLH